jgi:hypothetical protein
MHHKPQTAPALDTDVLQQVDKFLKSLGLAPEQAENNSERQQNTTTGEQVPLLTKEGEVNSRREESPAEEPAPTPEKNTGIPTKGNKNAAEVYNDIDSERAETPETEKNKTEDQSNLRGTTFVSPGGLINIRANKDSDAQGGTTT